LPKKGQLPPQKPGGVGVKPFIAMLLSNTVLSAEMTFGLI
jgi:hypothetical protein